MSLALSVQYYFISNSFQFLTKIQSIYICHLVGLSGSFQDHWWVRLPNLSSNWKLLTSSMHVSNVTLFQAITGSKNPNQGLDRIDINYKLLTLDELDVDTKGSIHYIFPSLFNKLEGSTCETRINVFYFTSKVLFVLEMIKF